MLGIPYTVMAVVSVPWGYVTDFFRRRGLRTVFARKGNTTVGKQGKKERMRDLLFMCVCMACHIV